MTDDYFVVTIDDGTSRHIVRTAAGTVAIALAEAGIALRPGDGVEPPLNAALRPNATITVHRGRPYQLLVDGRLLEIRSAHARVGDVVAGAGIALAELDYTRPPRDALVQPGNRIEVIRVVESVLQEEEPIPFETEWQGTDALELDSQALLTEGADGLRQRRIRIRIENGAEVSRAVEAEWIARQPVAQVMGYGTRIVPRTLETTHGTITYWRKVRMRVTSYNAASSGKPPEHPAYGITRSGDESGFGIVAVDPAIVPFGSYVYVPGYGVGYAGDTGGGIQGRWIDLGYEDAALRLWWGYVDVYYLTPVPPAEAINYQLPAELP